MNKLEEFHKFLDSTNPAREYYNLDRNEHVVNIYDGSQRVDIQFHGWALVLLPNGTWYCLDTSGG